MDVRYRLKKLIRELEKMKGQHTELVSVYIPAGYNLNAIIDHLSKEHATASNIQSKQVRKNVMDALEKIINELRKYRKTPENGLAVFCGNINGELRIWAIEPPEPLNIRVYRCDKEFVLDPLKEMVEPKKTYGLIVLDTKEATFGFLKGRAIIPLKNLESVVPGKFRKGGQSAVRFQREREGLIRDWFKKLGEIARDLFEDKVDGILIGGPGPAKEEFYNGNFLIDKLKKKVVAVKDIGYTDEYGLHELVDKSADVLAEEEVMREKQIVREFFEHIAKDDGLATYGKTQVLEALQVGAVDKLLVSEDIDEELLEKLEEEAKKFGTEIFLISKETREGVQFAELGGIGAILRFKLEN